MLLVALASSGAIAVYRYHAAWTPLQRVYAPTYLRCQLMAALGFTTTGRYRLLEVEGLAGTRLALDDEVQPGPARTRARPFALTDAARADRRSTPGLARRLVPARGAARVPGALDLSRSDARGRCCDRRCWGGLVVLVGGPAGRDAEGCGARARPATGAPAQGARARVRRAVQSAVSRRRDRLRADAARVRPHARGCASRARSSRATSSSWATRAPGSPR